jgi:two-component system OmpR family sensor kinase
MSAIDSSPAKRVVAATWLTFAVVNTWLMFALPGKETIPYHLIWASFAFLYGLIPWSRRTTWIGFWGITVATGVPLIEHAWSLVIGWEECSEIVLMGVLVALLIWHVDRHRAAQAHLQSQREIEAMRSNNREITARFGSHEVRTRLTIARGFVELIRNAAVDEMTRADADLVIEELDKASALTTKLLTLVRVEASTPRQPFHLDDLIERVVRRWEATAKRAWSADSSVGVLFGDPERLEAALDCLIENALKFTTTTDAIEVSARASGDHVLISVRDTGDGIPERDLQRILEVFQTGSAAGARAGSGLGLAIVRAVAESRGGALEVASTETVGTCFTIRAPLGFEVGSGRAAALEHTPPLIERDDDRPAAIAPSVLQGALTHSPPSDST